MRLVIKALAAACLVCPALLATRPAGAEEKSIEIRLVDQFNAMFGKHPGFRANHAKGAVFDGTFTPNPSATSFTKAAFLKAASVPAVIRFSNSGGLPDAPDTHTSALTRGMAIKLTQPDGSEVDFVCISIRGFPVRTGEDFLALLQAVAATKPDTPKPTPLDKFLASHPVTAKAIATLPRTPASYATEPYFGINAFKFTNAEGATHFGRYRIVPEAGEDYLTPEQAAARSPNFLADDMRERVKKGPVKFRVLVQVAQAGDPTDDPTAVWPDDRPTVELGELSITKAAADSLAAEKQLLFLPTNLTDGIEPSDDPLIPVRTGAYVESFGRRSQ
jgi:catalase